ncbi:hypothetical protein QCN27_06015 [Cereibacter sp. SYSU M97828]|nr:hypothetical protein [Cereibacter flavus]
MPPDTTTSPIISHSVSSERLTKLIADASAASLRAFFSHLRGSATSAEDVSPKAAPEDLALMLPALELYFNGCASLPEADALLAYGLAVTARSELSNGFCAFAVVTLEPTDSLQVFVSDIIDRYHDDASFIELLRGVLSYVARDGGQGVCSTRRLAEFAMRQQDAELLEVLVDFQTRAPFFRMGPRRSQSSYERTRLEATKASLDTANNAVHLNWSGLSQRASAAVVAIERPDHENSLIEQAHKKVAALDNKFSLPQPRRLPAIQVNFLYEILDLDHRETVVSGGLGEPLIPITPSYSQAGPPERSRTRRRR